METKQNLKILQNLKFTIRKICVITFLKIYEIISCILIQLTSANELYVRILNLKLNEILMGDFG